MSKIIILFIFFIVFYNYCSSQIDSSIFKYGVLNESVFKCEHQENVLVDIKRGKLIKGYECKVKGMNFLIGLDSLRNEILYYTTSDSSFLVNGFNYLTRKRNVLDSLKKEKIILEYNWTIYIPLQQEWNLAFKYSDLVVKKGKAYLKKGAFPAFLFKRKKGFRGPYEYIIAK